MLWFVFFLGGGGGASSDAVNSVQTVLVWGAFWGERAPMDADIVLKY